MSDLVAAVRQPQETEKTTSVARVSTPFASKSQLGPNPGVGLLSGVLAKLECGGRRLSRPPRLPAPGSRRLQRTQIRVMYL
jgi:hypothetical protein